MIIHLATDHAGFELKESLKAFLLREGIEIVDHGATAYNPDDDFPDFITLAAGAVSQNPDEDRAIILGGSGQGEAMLANRFPRVRAAVYYGGAVEIVKLSREHNDANVLSLGARFLSAEEAELVVRQWLTTAPMVDEKYARRIDKIKAVTDAMY